MSVYRDTNASVYFEHPFPGPLTATVNRDGVVIFQSEPLTPVAGVYKLDLSYRETQFDGQLDITWQGIDGELPFTRSTSVDVITPLVSISEMRTLFSDTNWTDAELMELENNVRVFIESYTGQSFGYEIGSYDVVGNGEKKIALPKRLISFTTIAGGPPGYFTVANNGWYLYITNKNLLEIKEAPPEDYMVYATHGLIVVPDSYWRAFRTGILYTITGEWGYYSVPEDVKAAAKILANDYACGDNLYRDRYLEAMKAGDWNLVFNQAAYRDTGNVRADQLLEKYRRQGMVII